VGIYRFWARRLAFRPPLLLHGHLAVLSSGIRAAALLPGIRDGSSDASDGVFIAVHVTQHGYSERRGRSISATLAQAVPMYGISSWIW
jgi:hypothetical protein